MTDKERNSLGKNSHQIHDSRWNESHANPHPVTQKLSRDQFLLTLEHANKKLRVIRTDGGSATAKDGIADPGSGVPLEEMANFLTAVLSSLKQLDVPSTTIDYVQNLWII